MMIATIPFLVAALPLLLSACSGSVKGGSPTVDPQEAALNAGIASLGGVLDEQIGGAGFTRVRAPFPAALAFALAEPLPRALAAACARAVSQTCSADTKGVAYSGCTGRAGALAYEGSVQLDWTGDGDCVLDDGETVTRTAAVTITGPYGGTLAITSADGRNYLGHSFGGGASLTQTSAGNWQVNIAGQHKTLRSRGRAIYGVSVRTGTAVGVTGTIARAGRNVNGGTLVVHHNIAQFTATYAPIDLTYSNFHCHPQSGSLAVTYSGSQTGTATVVFTGGSSARISKDGINRNVTLEYCE